MYHSSREDGRNRPFFVSKGRLFEKIIPMTGFLKCLVVVITCHVGKSAPACRENYMACRPRRTFHKVKNVNVEWKELPVLRSLIVVVLRWVAGERKSA